MQASHALPADPNLIDSFPQDGQHWRLDWIGDVFRQRHLSADDFFVRIVLSQVSPSETGEWVYPTSPEIAPHHLEVGVRVGALPKLPLGTIWRDGRLAVDPVYQTLDIEVNVNKETTRPIRAGTPDPERGYILPFSAHPYHREHTQSYCVRVEVGDGRVLIVPAIELIRCYFGSSSFFMRRLFLVPFKTERFWLRKSRDTAGVVRLALADKISGMSAHDIGRIAFDPMAYRAATMISQSLTVASASGNPLYPKTTFPYEGKSNLSLKGVWLPGCEPKTFLVFQILSCSHPFPFTRLFYEQAKKQGVPSKHGNDEKREAQSAPTDRMASGDKKDEDSPLVNKDPDKKLATKNLFLDCRVRFPDLTKKMICRSNPLVPMVAVPPKEAHGVTGLSVGESGTSQGVRPIDLIRSVDAPDPAKLQVHNTDFGRFVSSVLNRLDRELYIVWHVALHEQQRYPQYSKMPKLVSEDGEVHPVSYVTHEGRKRDRYVSVLRMKEIQSDDHVLICLPEFVPSDSQYSVPMYAGHRIPKATIDAPWIAERLRRLYWGEEDVFHCVKPTMALRTVDEVCKEFMRWGAKT